MHGFKKKTFHPWFAVNFAVNLHRVNCWRNSSPQKLQFDDNLLRFMSLKMLATLSTYLEKCSITSLAHQWILCSEWVPSEWESKQLIKTSQESTSNPHHSGLSIKVLKWKAACLLETNPLKHFNFKLLFSAKMWVLYYIEKVVSSNQERNMHRSSTVFKPKQF